MRILFIIPDLGYGGAAKQLSLLASELPRNQFQTRVCVLGMSGYWSAFLASNGVPVEALRWTRAVDARPLLRLRCVVREFQPDVIHVWGLRALRAAMAATRLGLLRNPKSEIRNPKKRDGAAIAVVKSTRVVVSKALRAVPGRVSGVDRWLLRRANQVVAEGLPEARRYQQLGVAEHKLCFIPPGVRTAEAGTNDIDIKRSLGLTADAQLLACVGPLQLHKGYRDAVWALDILKYVYDGLHLMLIGEGPEREQLERFAQSIRVNDRVHFLGHRTDISGLLRQADLVWVPSERNGGTNVALEAMAAGRAVIATSVGGLADIVVDGETGFLIDRGDKVALARRTHLLLEDEARRMQFGEAGRERVRCHFPVSEMVSRYSEMLAAA
jgi:glycosyltransferase involved in cell wall biosynthesis